MSCPFKVYCFNSVISQLEALLKRPKFPINVNSGDTEKFQTMFTVIFMVVKVGRTF